MFRTRSVTLALALAFLCIAFTAASAWADKETGYPVEASPDVQKLGVRPATAKVEAAADKTAHTVRVYTVFDKSFTGRLNLRAFDKNGVEVARSGLLDVRGVAGQSQDLFFVFPPEAPVKDFAKVMVVHIPPPKHQESVGEEAKNIVKELLQ